MSMTGRMTAVATLVGSLAFFLATMGLGIGLVLATFFLLGPVAILAYLVTALVAAAR